jgi:RNA polymerase sigma factor (sigma-70 family)
MTEEPISHWLHGLARGDQSAVRKIWEQYFERLVQLARRRLAGSDRRMSDEEDVALSAFHSLCRGAAEGRFARLEDRDDLWRLLMVITARKAIHQKRYNHRQKRGGGRVRGESALTRRGSSEDLAAIGQALGTEPTPEFAAQMNEQCERMLDDLHDGSLKTMALLKLEGYTNQEIADQLGYTVRTVGRKLQRTRQIWERFLEDDEGPEQGL